MFYFTYLRRELRRRIRQAIFIGLGLAIGIGLVITVMGASAGIKTAQASVLRSLYGIGTDLTVTKSLLAGSGQVSQSFRFGPDNTIQACDGDVCHTKKITGDALDQLTNTSYGTLSAATVAKIARLRDVAEVADGLILSDTHSPLPSANAVGYPSMSSVYGTDLSHLQLGPISLTRLISGRGFTSADAKSAVALVDSDYATAHNLKVGDTVDVGGAMFTIIGIVKQAQGDSPPDVYVPLARAQELATNMASFTPLTGDINVIYVTAASAADISTVQREIEHLLPSATVASSSSLASEITGSLASAAKLINDLGKWLAIMVLIAAFAIAALLTLAAVSRRVQEFGTLKAVGWRGSRIVSQVVGESVVTGVCGGIAGIGLGVAGIAIINALAVKLPATVPSNTANAPTITQTSPGKASSFSQIPASHTVLVSLSASVTADAIGLAIVLAVAGGLLAGLVGAWRAARLRPAAALTTVA
jgi:putative ABC transport system permease protein